MQKVHDPSKNSKWVDYPDIESPIIADELNRHETELDEIDSRVVVHETTKANQVDLLTCVASITLNSTTGILTITLKNGSSTTIDTGLSKLAVNFDYDADPTSPHYEQLILEMADGTYKYIDLSALITQFEFVNSATITWTVGNDGKVTANIINGSITEEMLETNFLANCRLEVSKALGFSQDAEAWAKGTKGGTPVASTDEHYHNNAKYYSEVAHTEADNATTKAQDSEAWAVGKRNGQDVPSTDETYHNNAKYWAEQAEGAVTGNDKVTWEANGILGAKNLIPYPYPLTFPQTNHGITFTDNNGVIETSGTQDNQDASIANVLNAWGTSNSVKLEPNTKYIISGCPSGGSASSYYLQPVLTDSSNKHIWLGEFGDELEFTTDSTHLYLGLRISIAKGYTGQSLVFKPMLRLASDTDSTYQPYAETNYQLTHSKLSYKDNGVLGAKNLIPYPYDETTNTSDGITWADNGDGTITANGTSTKETSFTIINGNSPVMFPSGNYKIDQPVPYSTLQLFFRVYDKTGGGNTRLVDYNTDGSFTLTQPTPVAITIIIRGSQTVDNFIIKPMIRLASDNDDTYQPYAKTNQQLTKDVNSKQNASDNSLNTTNKTIVGAINEVNNGLSTLTTKLGNYLSVVTYSKTATISANTGGMLKEDISSIIPSGKVPIGIVGCSFPGNTSFGTNEIIVENGVYKYHGVVLNHTGSAITGEWKVYILCAG